MDIKAIVRFDDLHQRYERGEVLTDAEAAELRKLALQVRAEWPHDETEIVRAMRLAGEREDCALEVLRRAVDAAGALLGAAVVAGVKGAAK